MNLVSSRKDKPQSDLRKVRGESCIEHDASSLESKLTLQAGGELSIEKSGLDTSALCSIFSDLLYKIQLRLCKSFP